MPNNSEVEDAISKVNLAIFSLNQTKQSYAIRNEGKNNKFIGNTIKGDVYDGGIDSLWLNNRISINDRDDVLQRLEEIKKLLLQEREGKDNKSKIRNLVQAFKGSQIGIQTFLLTSQFIAWIMKYA